MTVHDAAAVRLYDKAACLGMPGAFDTTDWAEAQKLIAEYCDFCPVVTECRKVMTRKGGMFSGVAAGQVWTDGRLMTEPPKSQCGTEAGYQGLHGGTCRACRDAHAAHERGGSGSHQPRRLAPCGTKSARRRHRRWDETCAECEVTPDPPTPLRPCGTRAAYERHRSNGEQACEACKAAEAEYRTAMKQARKQRASAA